MCSPVQFLAYIRTMVVPRNRLAKDVSLALDNSNMSKRIASHILVLDRLSLCLFEQDFPYWRSMTTAQRDHEDKTKI